MPQSPVLTLRAGEITASYPSKDYRGISYEPHLSSGPSAAIWKRNAKPYAAWTGGMIISWYATEGEAREGLALVRPDGRLRAFVSGQEC